MPCNFSGYFDYSIAGKFAVVDYEYAPLAPARRAGAPTVKRSATAGATAAQRARHSLRLDAVRPLLTRSVARSWSNGKEMWANPKRWQGGLAPDGKMDCQERLVEQAKMTKAHAKSLGIEQKVWVYRNLVKALPWYSLVRGKLNDPAYSGFFLKFDDSKKPFHVPQCDSASGRCTEYYHDQTQSPQSGANCSACKNCGCCMDGACDVGTQPCGEYLWNHANGSQLRKFLVDEYIGGKAGLGDPNIDGVFLDDGWGAGPSEIESHSVADMGLLPSQVADIDGNWSATCKAVSTKLAEMKGWSWQMSQNPYPGACGNANPGGMKPAVCSAFLRKACAPKSSMHTAVNIFTFTRNPVPGAKYPAPFPLKNAEQVFSPTNLALLYRDPSRSGLTDLLCDTGCGDVPALAWRVCISRLRVAGLPVPTDGQV